MTLSQMDCFVEAAKAGNISKAAETLFITQQAISSQIKALETELGYKLFHRGNKGISLTKEGEILFAEWVDIRDRIRISIDKAADYHNGWNDHIQIGLADMGGCSEDIMSAFSEYEKKYEDLHIDFELMTPKQMLEQFEKNNLDMAILYQSEFDKETAFKCLPLHKKSLNICVFMSHKHPLANKEDLSLTDLSDEVIGLLNTDYSLDFKKTMNGFFTRAGLKVPQNYKEYRSRRDLEIALIAGRCVTIVYETMFLGEKDKLYSKKLDLPKFSSRIALFWKEDSMDIKAHALADILRHRLHKLD